MWFCHRFMTTVMVLQLYTMFVFFLLFMMLLIMCKGHAVAEEWLDEASQQPLYVHLLPSASIMEINRAGILPASTLLYAKLLRKDEGGLRQWGIKMHLYSYV